MKLPTRLGRSAKLVTLVAACALSSGCADLRFPQVPGAASASNAPPPPSPGAEPSTKAKDGLSIDTPVATIAASPQGKAVLDRDLPGLISRPEYPLFKMMSLRKIAAMSNGKISQQTLDQVGQDLAQLPSQP